MKKAIILWAALWQMAGASVAAAPHIGVVVKTYSLDTANTSVRGLAFDDTSPSGPRLFVLDDSCKVFVYERSRSADELKLLSILDLPADADGRPPVGPRGLAVSRDGSQLVLYFLDWSRRADGIVSRLWRWIPKSQEVPEVVDLSLYPFRIGEREVLDIAFDNGKILISFDASNYSDRNLRVLRGLIRLSRDRAAGSLEFEKHIPDSGLAPALGLSFMTLDGVRYLWGTIGADYLYCAEAETGRGLFHFKRPRPAIEDGPAAGLAFGDGALWSAENAPGPDRVHRINVIENLDAPAEGPRILRRLIMSIKTQPEIGGIAAGRVAHNYSRPYAFEQLGNQGIWADTETFGDLSDSPKATAYMSTQDPGGDIKSRQYIAVIDYPDGPARASKSRYEIDVWTNPYRKFIYPHRVDKNQQALKGTDYLSDDPVLYNLSDVRVYDDFVQRVRDHTQMKYGVEADLAHPYWAARNVLEYLQDKYYYPSRPKRVPATVDYERDHYDANPANRKLELSGRPYDRTQIIACSGTSVMLAGVMRHLGLPARWLGTGTQQGPGSWDMNGNGFLDEDEIAPCSNGHRYTQVWLGSHYGWICFDGTPALPDDMDFDPEPPLQSQWRYMNRAAAGHLNDKRIVFNVASTFISQFYRDFLYDEALAVDNNCGGDQRYNLMGRFERPELWKLSRQSIAVMNICFVDDVQAAGPRNATVVTWALRGRWDRDSAATLDIILERAASSGGFEDLAVLRSGVPAGAGRATIDLTPYKGDGLRIAVRKTGDKETGNRSDPLDLK